MARTLPSLVAAVALLAVPAFADSPEDASRTAIAGQIAAFQAEDGDTAYSYAAPSVRRFFPNKNAFMNMVRSGYEPVYDPTGYSFGRFAERNGQLYQEVLITGPKGKDWVALYTLEMQDDGSVLITGCRLVADDTRSI